MSLMKSVFQRSIQNKHLMVPQHRSCNVKVRIFIAFTGRFKALLTLF